MSAVPALVRAWPPGAPGDLGAAADPAPALRAVTDLLVDRLDQLDREWSLGSSLTDPVLGTADVPVLLRRLVLDGGKRLRPLMCHWGWVAGGGAARGEDPAPVHVAGAALELLHAFGLVQDDVMDESATRRGRPAVHVVASAHHESAGGRDDATRYGESIAVLVGDLAHAEADSLVGELPAPARRVWWRTSVELVRGQARDLSGAARTDPADALDHALEVAHLKSGAYTVQRPLQLGATLAGASAAVLQPLTSYGRHLGTAFALRDDLLGVFGDPARTGKPAGDDLRSAKATVLVALAERRCSGPAAAAVARLRVHRHDAADVALIRDAMVSTGVRDEVEARVARAVRGASAALDAAAIDPTAREALGELAREIAWRDH